MLLNKEGVVLGTDDGMVWKERGFTWHRCRVAFEKEVSLGTYVGLLLKEGVSLGTDDGLLLKKGVSRQSTINKFV